MLVKQQRPASACDDCRLCSRDNETPHNGAAFVESIVSDVVQRVRDGNTRPLSASVGVSARHCHLSSEGMEILFGPGSELTPFKDLYQPGAFAAEEMVSVVGPRLRAIERVRILGPTRNYNQVELARTDAIFLGLNPPVRDSGDLEGAEPITFVGPAGSITVPAAIRAIRHLHLRPSDVSEMGLGSVESVKARVGGVKGVVYENVRLKIDPSYLPELHLDTDDANAADIVCGDSVEIEK
jgi:putative phosphotransacetylase